MFKGIIFEGKPVKKKKKFKKEIVTGIKCYARIRLYRTVAGNIQPKIWYTTVDGEMCLCSRHIGEVKGDSQSFLTVTEYISMFCQWLI